MEAEASNQPLQSAMYDSHLIIVSFNYKFKLLYVLGLWISAVFCITDKWFHFRFKIHNKSLKSYGSKKSTKKIFKKSLLKFSVHFLMRKLWYQIIGIYISIINYSKVSFQLELKKLKIFYNIQTSEATEKLSRPSLKIAAILTQNCAMLK